MLSIWLGIDLHPFHVSVVEIEHNTETKSLQITHHIFLDDLEEALEEKHGIFLDIVNPKDPAQRDLLVKKYVEENFEVAIDGKIKTGNYLGHEIEQDAIFCYVEVNGVKKMKAIRVNDSVLIEKFTDQVNLVHITYLGKVRSLKLDRDTQSGEIIYGK